MSAQACRLRAGASRVGPFANDFTNGLHFMARRLIYAPILFAVTAGGSAVMSAGAQNAKYTPTDASGQIVVILQNHAFSPSEIHVPVGKRIQILVKNRDATAEEFDSSSLKVEKVIGGGSEGIVRLHPLDPGSYPFTGEYHSDTAKGVVIAE